MRTTRDVLRSLQRYTGSILPAPWDVRISLENATPDRPFVLVTQNGPALTIGSFGAHSLRRQIAVSINAYLPEGVTREAAEEAAADLGEALWVGMIARGTQPATRGQLLPLWDFIGDTTEGLNPPRGHCDYATMVNFFTRAIPDQANPRLMTAVTDMRLQWWRAGAVADPGITPWTAVRSRLLPTTPAG